MAAYLIVAPIPARGLDLIKINLGVPAGRAGRMVVGVMKRDTLRKSGCDVIELTGELGKWNHARNR